MELAARRQAPTVRLRRLAAELKSLRVGAGLTQKDVGDKTGINEATLYRIETARQKPQRRTVLTLLDVYRVTDEAKRADLIALLRQAAQLGWLQEYEGQLTEEYTTYISFEADARSIRNYESLFVPGLLQTEKYCRAMIQGIRPEASEDDIERRVEVRRQRRAVLEKDGPINLWAIVDEAALRHAVGGQAVMAEQLRALIEAASKPNVTFQVIPFGVGAHPGMHGAFAIMDFPDAADPDIVYVESMAGALFLEGADVRRYSGAFHHLIAAALSKADSVGLIASLAEAQ